MDLQFGSLKLACSEADRKLGSRGTWYLAWPTDGIMDAKNVGVGFLGEFYSEPNFSPDRPRPSLWSLIHHLCRAKTTRHNGPSIGSPSVGDIVSVPPTSPPMGAACLETLTVKMFLWKEMNLIKLTLQS